MVIPYLKSYGSAISFYKVLHHLVCQRCYFVFNILNGVIVHAVNNPSRLFSKRAFEIIIALLFRFQYFEWRYRTRGQQSIPTLQQARV